ncbi:MAG: oligosaccharide flippase family protein [Croceibacterium sp.]
MNLKLNILTNLTARVWSALMSFAFVPLYIHFLGIEGYGLIGLFAALMGICAFLDLGLSVTVNREMARRGRGHDVLPEARDLLRTLEAVYWAVAALIGLGMAAWAPFLAEHWLNLKALRVADAEGAIRLMGLAAFMRWPVALYIGALCGVHRQVVANVVTVVASTLASGGAVLILWLAAPRIEFFFLWQAAALRV